MRAKEVRHTHSVFMAVSAPLSFSSTRLPPNFIYYIVLLYRWSTTGGPGVRTVMARKDPTGIQANRQELCGGAARLDKGKSRNNGDGTRMVHDTPARQKAREMREEAHNMSREAGTLAGIEGLEAEATARQERAKELQQEARKLQYRARLEDLTVRQVNLWKDTQKKGRQNYPRWVCSWQEGDRIVTKYLGSCRRMGEVEALEKARAMKAAALGIHLSD